MSSSNQLFTFEIADFPLVENLSNVYHARLTIPLKTAWDRPLFVLHLTQLRLPSYLLHLRLAKYTITSLFIVHQPEPSRYAARPRLPWLEGIEYEKKERESETERERERERERKKERKRTFQKHKRYFDRTLQDIFSPHCYSSFRPLQFKNTRKESFKDYDKIV